LGQYVDKFLCDIGIHSGEGMIKKYLIDKNTATEDIEKFVVTYYEKKSGASKGSDIGPVPTPKPGIHDTELVWDPMDKSRQSNPWLWLTSVMSRKKMFALFGIVLLVAGTLIVMLSQSGHRRPAAEALAPIQPFPATIQEPHRGNDQQAAMPPLPEQTTPSAIAQNFDSENLKQSAPIVSSTENKPRTETAPIGLETKLPAAHPTASIAYTANPKKKSPTRKPLTRMRKSTVPVDNSNITGGEQPQTTAPLSPSVASSEDTRKGIGTIHIYSYPWAEIYIDDAYQGTSPTPKPISLSEGNHTLVLKRDGFKTYSESIHIAKNEEQHIKVQLEQ
ncbi:MAG TPA: PEGA domain-containing protein, partial [Chitinivibrionales bacterium]